MFSFLCFLWCKYLPLFPHFLELSSCTDVLPIDIKLLPKLYFSDNGQKSSCNYHVINNWQCGKWLILWKWEWPVQMWLGTKLPRMFVCVYYKHAIMSCLGDFRLSFQNLWWCSMFASIDLLGLVRHNNPSSGNQVNDLTPIFTSLTRY